MYDIHWFWSWWILSKAAVRVAKKKSRHGTKSLRSHKLLRYSRIVEYFMECECSLLCSQEPFTDLYLQIVIQSISPHSLSQRLSFIFIVLHETKHKVVRDRLFHHVSLE
jgi:hypothetical protein